MTIFGNKYYANTGKVGTSSTASSNGPGGSGTIEFPTEINGKYGNASKGGDGGNNGTPYGGGGGGAGKKAAGSIGGTGGANGENGEGTASYNEGGNGGPGAVILEYYDPAA
jgi:hypothetical protein